MSRRERPDAYAVLGVAPDASDTEISRAYRRLLRTHHPDTGQTAAADPNALAALLEAYALLRDPHRRAAYDRGRVPPVTRRPPAPRPDRQPDVHVGPVRWHPTP